MQHWIKGLFAGLGGGMVGLAVMNRFMARTAEPVQRRQEEHPRQHHDVSVTGWHPREGENATAALAKNVYRSRTGRDLPAERAEKAGMMVHTGYGLLTAVGYGMVRGRRRGADLKGGALFGAGLWLLGDEIAVPLLGLSQGPKAHSPALLVQTLAAHIAFGVAVAATAQTLRRVLP